MDVKGGSDMGNQPMGLVRLILTHAKLKGARPATVKAPKSGKAAKRSN